MQLSWLLVFADMTSCTTSTSSPSLLYSAFLVFRLLWHSQLQWRKATGAWDKELVECRAELYMFNLLKILYKLEYSASWSIWEKIPLRFMPMGEKSFIAVPNIVKCRQNKNLSAQHSRTGTNSWTGRSVWRAMHRRSSRNTTCSSLKLRHMTQPATCWNPSWPRTAACVPRSATPALQYFGWRKK